MLLTVKHNIEVAHRLFDLKGKCENIHGHSMWVELSLVTRTDENGVYALDRDDNPLDFGSVKKRFREYLDTNYDHHLLLNKNDPWAAKLYDQETEGLSGAEGHLPGLVPVEGDPSTENIARVISYWALATFELPCTVTVDETRVNSVTLSGYGDDKGYTVG